MKKKHQRALSSVLAAGMLVSMAPTALASDLTGHWAQSSMEKFIDSKYLFGYGNDVYGPDNNMTRAEFAALINRVTGLTKESADISKYTDVPANAWYRADLAKALAEGYMNGVSDTKMAPEATITREEAFCMVARILKLSSGNVSNLDRFSDKADVGSWATSDVADMVAAGYVTGTDLGTLLPKKNLTRAEGVTILNNALDALKKLNENTNTTKPSGGSSSSATIYTVSNWQELRNAAQKAGSGDTIRLSSDIKDAGSEVEPVDGVTSATLSLAKKNLTFDGNGKTITAAENKTFCFDVDGAGGKNTDITIKNLIVDGASFSEKFGGGFFVEDGVKVTFDGVTVKNSHAGNAGVHAGVNGSANGGGAIFVNDHGNPPEVSIKNCTFENNYVGEEGKTGRGGAIYANNFRSATPLKVTVENSIFKGNKAAYGGAIAADGVVDLTVTGCTFENNECTVGADDIYIFDGVSAGKKGMIISSNVTATLSGNTYSNNTDGATQDAMNVIYGRYYDATASVKHEAPTAEEVHDLTFIDNDRTKLTSDYTYAYAAVPYDEYWKSEGVYLEGNDWAETSNEADRNYEYDTDVWIEEHDKGAFDAVSRATSRHGVHRGSFQQDVTIHTTGGTDYHPTYWTDGNNFVDANGNTYDKSQIGITSYNITGIKYVPVAIPTADFDAFKQKYTVVENGETLAGGYSEVNLSSYNDLIASVDADTNGLKVVTKDGSHFSFSARKTGSGSGIQNQELANASNITTTAKEYSGNYGEHLRVDLTGDGYGALGSRMQTVVWNYYGPSQKVLATYGTKFAADNWMHKTNGIQLGLTDSMRFKLPEGTDGTGKWTITVYALGYADYTTEFEVTKDNLPKDTTPMTNEQKTQLTELKSQAEALLTDYDETTASDALKALKEHYDEAVAMLNNSDATSAAAAELIAELPSLIEAVNPTPSTTRKEGEAAVGNFGYTAKVLVTIDADGKIVSVEDNNTDAGNNSSFWNSALSMLNSFSGKTKDNLDTVDGISGATVSSNAIKTAVANALNK